MSSIDFSKVSDGMDVVPSNSNPDWSIQNAPERTPPNYFGDDSDMEGEITSRDIGVPRISLIHPLDKRAGDFTVGRFVYANELELSNPFDLVVIKAKKGYYEKIDRKTQPMAIPRVVWTAAEVRDLGGTLSYIPEPGTVPFGDMAELLVLVGQKNDGEGLLPFEIEGTHWGPAIYRVKATSYIRVFKVLSGARALVLREGLLTGKWSMDVTKETISNNQVLVPLFKFRGKNSPEFVEQVKDLVKSLSN
jgi:hypothetical protein